MTCPIPGSSWQCALLRGLAVGPGGPHALVRVSAGQFLRVPLPAAELLRWQGSVGSRVWIDAQTQPVRMRRDACGPVVLGARHA